LSNSLRDAFAVRGACEGTAYADLIWHSMMHVLFHGAQHRSEAAQIVTAYGCSPGELDFFVFLRQKGRDQEK
jgi:uncharacterized damage-inducible protein DinB